MPKRPNRRAKQAKLRCKTGQVARRKRPNGAAKVAVLPRERVQMGAFPCPNRSKNRLSGDLTEAKPPPKEARTPLPLTLFPHKNGATKYHVAPFCWSLSYVSFPPAVPLRGSELTRLHLQHDALGEPVHAVGVVLLGQTGAEERGKRLVETGTDGAQEGLHQLVG